MEHADVNMAIRNPAGHVGTLQIFGELMLMAVPHKGTTLGEPRTLRRAFLWHPLGTVSLFGDFEGVIEAMTAGTNLSKVPMTHLTKCAAPSRESSC